MNVMLKVFVSWRMAVVLLLGFASGLPFALSQKALQSWMTKEQIDLTTIGVFSLVSLPYAFKFLWSPLMDRFVPPFLGRRRGWMLITQICLVAAIIVMGVTGFEHGPWPIAMLAVVVAFFSASQDIAIDAYRTDLLESSETGAGSALAIMGWRIGFLFSGGLSMVLADHISWRTVYMIMAGAMAVGMAAALLAPEPKTHARPPATLIQAVVNPFREFLSRRGAWEMLLFILIYKLDWVMVDSLTVKFLQSIGFTQTDTGAISQALGIVPTIIGTLIGGAVMFKFGIHRSLWIFGLLQGFAGLSYALLAKAGHSYPMMFTAVIVENVCSGMATAVFLGFIMTLCDKRFTATQFALLTSLMALGRSVGGAPMGWLAAGIGWQWYFIVSMLIAIPGLLLLTRYRHWQIQPVEQAPRPV